MTRITIIILLIIIIHYLEMLLNLKCNCLQSLSILQEDFWKHANEVLTDFLEASSRMARLAPSPVLVMFDWDPETWVYPTMVVTHVKPSA